MPAFILRMKEPDIVKLWEQFRQRCLDEGRSQRWVVLELIRRYVAHGLK
jgi:hypothetical protein